jgi:hypothetical protein
VVEVSGNLLRPTEYGLLHADLHMLQIQVHHYDCSSDQTMEIKAHLYSNVDPQHDVGARPQINVWEWPDLDWDIFLDVAIGTVCPQTLDRVAHNPERVLKANTQFVLNYSDNK